MAHPELDIWMNGERVGTWFRTRTGVSALRYDDAWLRSPNMRALSLSLPIPAGDKELRGPAVENYFDNLLPDSDRIRERLRRRFRTASTEAADLLAAIGRDCVGAVQLVPAGQAPDAFDRIDSDALTDTQVAQMLRNVTSDPVLGQAPEDDDFRISIAGAQEKTALLRIGDRWHRPHGATPTTHILKLPLGLIGNLRADMTHSVENEWLVRAMDGGPRLRGRRDRDRPFRRPEGAGRRTLRPATHGRRPLDRPPPAGRLLPGGPARRRRSSTRTMAGPARADASRCSRPATTRAPTGGASCSCSSRSGSWPRPTATPRTTRSSCGVAAAMR